MSGGSSSSTDWRPSPPAGGDDCNIIEITALNSPSKAVLEGLQANDVLDIAYEVGPPQRLVALRQGKIAGSITSPQMLAIIRCIADQHREYVAVMITIRGAIYQIRVQPK